MYVLICCVYFYNFR